MSDVQASVEDAPEREPMESAPAPRAGAFQDPVVRMMTYVALGLLILFLATIVGALVTGVGASDGPRTAAERDLLIAASAAKAGGATGAALAPYVNALIAAGNLQKARVTLDVARASVDSTTTPPELDVAEARLELAQKRYAQAARAAGEAMEGFEARHAARLAAGGTKAARAKQLGIEAEYYDVVLVRAYAYVGLRSWKDAVEAFDGFIARNPSAADVLVDRGNAKVELGDDAGAEKDFREALRFVPYDEGAKAGLERIGAAE